MRARRYLLAWGTFLCAAVLSLPYGAAPAWADPAATPAEIQRSLDQYAAQFHGVAVVAVVVDNGTSAVYAAGTAGPSGAKPDERTLFQIGSVTKTFTGTLLGTMVLDGSVKLTDPISKYLPPGVTAPAYAGQPMTLESLAEQNSGLPPIPSNLKPANQADPFADYTAPMLWSFLSHYKLTRAPGEQYEYSNLGVGLLGELLALRAKTTYGNLLAERVLHPLGMSATTLALAPAGCGKPVQGYTIDGEPAQPMAFRELAAAGGLCSDARDMQAYLKANLAAPAGPLGKAMALAQEPRADFEDAGHNAKIGLVWMTDPRTGIVWHNGSLRGYHAYIGFDRAAKTGVVVLARVADHNVDILGMHVLQPDAVSAPAPWPAAVSLPAATLDSYVGVYAFKPDFQMTVTRDGERLYAQAGTQPRFRIYPSSPTEFFFKAVDAQITFQADASGKVTRLVLHEGGGDAPAPKIK